MARPRSSQAFRPHFRPEGHFDRSAAHKPILVFEDVMKVFRQGQPVLRGVNLTIERGEFVFVTGPLGGGQEHPAQADLPRRHRRRRADPLLRPGHRAARPPESVPHLRRNIGVVFQDFRLVPYWSVYQNVAVALEVLGLSRG
jgi:cell division transport system ATP-binding protein